MGGHVDARAGGEQLDLELLDALGGLIARLLSEGEKIAGELGIPAVVMKALHTMDAPLAMKDVSKRLRCDPSFVTTVADVMEKRGLVKRESDPSDRRVKRLVLTEAGAQLRCELEQAMAARMPWHETLTTSERKTLLTLIVKMTRPLSATGDSFPAEEVKNFLSAAVPQPSGVGAHGTQAPPHAPAG
jgi:MarR family transcriptional regulator, organic hydroperoxide resistance regulator